MDLEKIKNEILEKYKFLEEWLKSLPLFYELGYYIFVHGGINGDNKDWKNGTIKDFVWSK